MIKLFSKLLEFLFKNKDRIMDALWKLIVDIVADTRAQKQRQQQEKQNT